MSAMNTFTGRIFDPLKMMKQDVCVEDIAHALSLVCRGGGHIRYFFSVAQHSMNCASEAAARGWSGRIVLACLLHTPVRLICGITAGETLSDELSGHRGTDHGCHL